jgi:uncharacterized membrane protein
LITYFFPPKKINTWYGFRTPSSQKNQQTWDIANKYAALYCIKAGGILMIAGILISLLVHNLLMPEKTRQLLRIILFMGSGVFIGPLLIVATEKHIDKTFKE